jgi:hypothetical protein
MAFRQVTDLRLEGVKAAGYGNDKNDDTGSKSQPQVKLADDFFE